MKQATNIALLIMVLSIPFALSQTRKAIPAGRYEALAGVKVSHSLKSTEGSAPLKDSLGLFWSEVTKHIPQGHNEYSYYSSGITDASFSTFLSSKGIREVKTLNDHVNIFLSDNLTRDNSALKKLKTKGSLVILRDKHPLKDVIANLSLYEVMVYQVEAENNYYLLKLK